MEALTSNPNRAAAELRFSDYMHCCGAGASGFVGHALQSNHWNGLGRAVAEVCTLIGCGTIIRCAGFVVESLIDDLYRAEAGVRYSD